VGDLTAGDGPAAVTEGSTVTVDVSVGTLIGTVAAVAGPSWSEREGAGGTEVGGLEGGG